MLNAQSLYNLGIALREQKKLDAAVAGYQKTLTLPEDNCYNPKPALITLANNGLGSIFFWGCYKFLILCTWLY